MSKSTKGTPTDSVKEPNGGLERISIAKQLCNALGYLHAKDIVHGRICSRNVFLESKVQLSLLDYAVGIQNTVYSSPQVTKEMTRVHFQFSFMDQIFYPSR